MSVSRNNWSALSRLAKQWSEDDEEEQIRERRRRTRISSNPGEKIVEVLPDEDSTPKYGNRKAKIETETPEPLKNNTVEENEGNREKPEEKLNHQHPVGKKEKGCMPDDLVEENKLTECPGDKTKDAFCKTEEMPTEEPRSKQEVQRSLRCVNQPEICQDKKDKSPTSEKEENQMSESEKKSNTMCVNRIKGKQKEELKGITHNTDEKKEEDYDQRDGRKKEIPSISSILSTTRISTVDLSTSTHPAEDLTKSNIVSSSSSGNASRYKSQVFVSSVKIQRCTSGSEGRSHILSPPPVPEEGPLHALEVAKQTDVQDPGLSSTSMTCKKHKEGGQQSDTHCVQDEFLSSAQATSSFRRFSPRTSSFRAITQNDDQVNSGRGLTRSSSLRISLRSSKLEDRLEKYTSAAQRSGSVRIPVHNRSTTGASDNIANIKSIFERDESSSGSNATNPRKDVKLPGSVSSRINQWSIKRQEGPSTNTGTKDIRTGDVAQKRNIWQQRSQSSSDTKL